MVHIVCSCRRYLRSCESTLSFMTFAKSAARRCSHPLFRKISGSLRALQRSLDTFLFRLHPFWLFDWFINFCDLPLFLFHNALFLVTIFWPSKNVINFASRQLYLVYRLEVTYCTTTHASWKRKLVLVLLEEVFYVLNQAVCIMFEVFVGHHLERFLEVRWWILLACGVWDRFFLVHMNAGRKHLKVLHMFLDFKNQVDCDKVYLFENFLQRVDRSESFYRTCWSWPFFFEYFFITDSHGEVFHPLSFLVANDRHDIVFDI